MTELANNAPAPQLGQDAFEPTCTDAYFALFAFPLGFLFLRWVFFQWQGWGVAVFTLLYCSAVYYYLRKKGAQFSSESYFWLSVLVLTGLSFALWKGNGLEPWRELFLLLTAVYWVLTATNMTMLEGTSDWVVLDGFHGLMVIPFRNITNQYRGLSILHNRRAHSKGQFWPVALGVLLALVVMIAVLPLLLSADSGGFSAIFDSLWDRVQNILQFSLEFMVQLLLAIPTAAYLYGLISGSAHKRGLPGRKAEDASRSLEGFRVLPPATVYTALGLISALYLLFILSQVPYFFSAFVGARPVGWEVYSEYARNGFFELVRIAVINLSLLAATNLGIRKEGSRSTSLKTLNFLLASLTLLLIATAFSKMALYISVYGLSVKRLLPCVFMVHLATVCIGIIVLQKKSFSIMYVAAITGAILLCGLSLIDPDALVANYNANRFLAGSLSSFDVAIVRRAGPAGIDAALRVYAATADEELREQLDEFLYGQRGMLERKSGTTQDTLQDYLARQKLARHVFIFKEN